MLSIKQVQTFIFGKIILKLFLILVFFVVCGLQQALAYTTVSGNLSGNTIWSSGTYYVSSDLTIPSGSSLTIEPGVVVKIATGKYINVYGTLDVNGLSTSKVTFTSYRDTNVGETVVTGIPARGDWGGLKMYNGSNNFVSLDDSIIKYASNGLRDYTGKNFEIIDSEITESSSYGIRIYSSSSCTNIDISGSKIWNNSHRGIFNDESGMLTVNISDSELTYNNSQGLYSSYGAVTLTNVTASNNTSYGVYVSGGKALNISGSSFSDNNNVGAYIASVSSANISDSDFNNNSGYGAYLITLSSSNISNCNFNNNSGYGFRQNSGSLIMLGCDILNNTSYGTYLGSLSSSNITNTNSNNNGGYGFYQAGGSLTMSGSNSLSNGNTGLYTGTLGAINISNSHFDDNTGSAYGGYLNSTSGINLSSVSFSGNLNYGLYINSTPGFSAVGVNSNGNGNYGLRISSTGNFGISDSSFDNNVGYGIYRTGNSTATIENSSISGNSNHGFYNISTGGSMIFEGNTVNNNGGYALYTYSLDPLKGVNTYIGNNKQTAYIYGDYYNGTDITIPNNGIDLYINNQYFTIASGRTVHVDPGVIFKFTYDSSYPREISVYGELDINGTEENKVVFTEINDNSVGEILGTGTPARGRWQGIKMYNGLNNFVSLDESIIKYTSNGLRDYTGKNFEIIDSEITESSSYGIRIYSSSSCTNIDISGSKIWNNSHRGIFNDESGMLTVNISDSELTYNNSQGLYSSYGAVTLTNVTVSNNTSYGVYVSGGKALNISGSSFSDNNNVGAYIASVSSANISDSDFNNNSGYGAYLITLSSSNISNCNFNNNIGHGIRQNAGSIIMGGSNVSNNSNYGAHMGSISSSNITNNDFNNNGSYGYYQGAGSLLFKNNIVYSNNNYGVYLSTVPASSNTIDYNLFYDNTTGNIYPTATSIGANSLTESPNFVDEINYQLNHNSPAIDAGDPALGLHPGSRTLYDIGFYEYTDYVYKTVNANLSNISTRNLTYTWIFIEEPSGGSDIPALSNVSGTITNRSLVTGFWLRNLGTYKLNLLIEEDGIEVGSGTLNMNVSN